MANHLLHSLISGKFDTLTAAWIIIIIILKVSSVIFVSGSNISQKSSGGCPVCTDRNILKEITKEKVKEEILSKLGFSDVPRTNVSNVSNVSELPYIEQKINEVRFSIWITTVKEVWSMEQLPIEWF